MIMEARGRGWNSRCKLIRVLHAVTPQFRRRLGRWLNCNRVIVLNAIVTAVFVNASGKAVSRSVTDVSCSALPVQLDCGFPRTGEDQEARLERIPEHFSWGGPKEFSVGSGVPSLARGTNAQ